MSFEAPQQEWLPKGDLSGNEKTAKPLHDAADLHNLSSSVCYLLHTPHVFPEGAVEGTNISTA